MNLNIKKLSTQEKEKPIQREGHTLTYLENLNKFVLIGGLASEKNSDVYLFDLSKGLFRIIKKIYNGAFRKPKDLSL